MDYLSDEEKNEMRAKFFDFDRSLIHETYGELVKRCEKE